ncbi:RNA methyltransferase [Marichromatium purpuratum 984]|uniref:tRNA (cytidine/uridine-2'-O-)-methyltransferase TrmJ n=1 Tax=Marichromatium purpuratum 984 TaxID=765910 RepID=W0E1Q0_MARPU|nr:RNA methyltransferase [Marichromatium purpuratum]AHF04780.1 RNA methyltransferase [Marichromatium purpuratum 984]
MTQTSEENFGRIRAVLIETSHPGNIGAAARALKTMGLSRLELVAPRQRPDAETLARAAGADDLIERAGIHDDLDSALEGCRLVIGASARLRSIEWPVLDPAEAAGRLLAEADHGEVAMLFGRESSGLTNAELSRCHYLVHIPTNPEFSSLNLAAAVQVLAYELRRHALAGSLSEHVDERPDLADAADLEGLHGHLAATMRAVGFGDIEQSRTLQIRLRRLFNRARPDRTEINILRGILSAAQGRKRLGRDDPAPKEPATPTAKDSTCSDD